jgi:hypothetical protein
MSIEYSYNNHSIKSQTHRHGIAKWLSWNMWVMQLTFQPLVFISFYIFVYNDRSNSSTYIFTAVFKQGFGLALIILEYSINNIKVLLLNLIIKSHYSQWPSVLISLVLYLIIIQFGNGDYFYSFLDVNRSYAWIGYLAIIVVSMSLHTLGVILISLRENIRGSRIWEKQGMAVSPMVWQERKEAFKKNR